jgi:hypothetical protein
MPVLAAILPIKSTLASPSIITPPKEISIKSTLQTLVPTIKPIQALAPPTPAPTPPAQSTPIIATTLPSPPTSNISATSAVAGSVLLLGVLAIMCM